MSDQTLYSIADLLFLMARLRDPDGGCPWDLQQSYKSITPSTIEEAYEVVDAIEKADYVHLKEELGDLLFQTIFYSQLAKEDGHFTFAEVVHTLVEKLIRRHPHVFPSGELKANKASHHADKTKAENEAGAIDESQVKQQWEAIKQQERKGKGSDGILADVPLALPSMTRASKLQKRAAQVGFDWPNTSGVMDKLQEEIRELEAALVHNDKAAIEDELGDLLFTCVNLSRHLKVDAEAALRSANTKFVGRFEYMEREIAQAGLDIRDLTPDLLEHWWQRAKIRDS